jgi:Toxin co-regulated pilus biosynthesis protein Q
MTRKAAILTVSVLSLMAADMPAYAGFEFVPPVRVETAPAKDAAPVAMPPVEMVSPTVAAAPVTAVEKQVPAVSSTASMPTPVADALKDLPIVTRAQAPAPAAVTVLPSRTEPVSVAQDRQRAVYPPPGNSAAAPLARNAVSETGLKMPTPIVERQARPVENPPATPIIWNETVPAVPASVMTDEQVMPSLPVTADTAPTKMASISTTYAPIEGFGDTIPMAVAFDQIVPKDFQVVYQDKPEAATLVSWSGGRPWNDVLSDMLYAHGYRAVFKDKTVTILKAGSSAPSQPKANDANAITPAAGMMTAPAASTQTVALTPKTSTGFDPARTEIFSARAGESVQDVLSRWSDQAKVQLYWTADRNYTLREAVAFNGTYSVAVKRLLDLFGSDSNRPVAKLHPNLPDGPAVLSVETAKT